MLFRSVAVGTLPNAPAVASQVRLFAAASCAGPFTQIDCAAAPQANTLAPALVVAGLSPNTTYYVLVAAYGQLDPRGPFSICVTDPPPCAPPRNVALGAVTATTARITLTPGPGNTAYAVRYYPTAQPALAQSLSPNPTTSPITIGGLRPFTNYTVTVGGLCGTSGAGALATLTFRTNNAQDEPADAVALPVTAGCANPTAGTVDGATASPANGYAYTTCFGIGPASPPLDVWYTVATAASGPASQGLTISAAGAAAARLRLFSSAGGAAGPFAPLGCSVSSYASPLAGAPPLTVLGLAPATTYYLSVAPYPASVPMGGFTLCATAPVACPAPIGLQASAVGSSSATLSWAVPGGTSSGTFSVEYGPAGFAPGTGAAGAVLVPGLSALSYAIASGLNPITTYDFYVSRDCGPGSGSSLRSGPSIFRTGAATPPPNDEACTAIALPLSGATCTSPTAGTTLNATDSNAPSTCAGGGATDVWYTFTTAATGPAAQAVLVTVVGADVQGFEVYQAPSCNGPFTTRACTALVFGGPPTVPPLAVSGLAAATTYYVRINGTGTFTICVSNPPACALPTLPTLTFVASTTATLGFGAAAGASGYTVVLTPASGPSQTLSVTAPPVALNNLTPNTAYTVCVTTNCAAGQAPPVCTSFSTLLPGPPNYLCANAIDINCGQLVLGTYANVPVQAAYPPTAPGASYGEFGVFYRFIGTGDSIVLRTCNPTTLQVGPSVGVYTGTCANLVGLTGRNEDPSCNRSIYFGRVGFGSRLNTVYYIYVTSGFAGTTGPFGMTVQCIPPPCPAPGSVAVSSLAPTSATVAFAAAAAGPAPRYTVVATPTAGGPPVVASGSASPLALTGLQPNTAYTVTVVANCTVNATSPPSAGVAIRTPLGTTPAALGAQLGLYPNPAHQSATLTLPAALLRGHSASAELLDGLGRTVLALPLPPATGPGEQRHTLPLAGLPVGLYVLRVRTAQGVATRQLVVE